jgi:GT2 family glycosyltransferase
MGDVEISVVIPVYNGATTIGDQLEALSRQSSPRFWEIVVADNGSTDNTLAIVDQWRPELPAVRVVDASKHRGVSHARNSGVLASRAPLVLICDADDVVASDWLEALALGLESADLVGGAFDFTALNGRQGGRSHDAQQTGLPIGLDFLPYAVGANFGMRRAVFEHIGGWDESYRSGGDDIDFSWRAQLAGFRLAYVPDAVVARRRRSSPTDLWKQFYGYGRAKPQLYAQYRRHGAAREPIRRTVKTWAWIVVHSPDLVRGSAARGRYLQVVGLRAGRIVGSLREGVICL